MQQELTNFNWAKQALKYIGCIGIVEVYEQWDIMLQRCMYHLKELTFADQVLLFKIEDKITVRVVQSEKDKNEVVYAAPSVLAGLDAYSLQYLQVTD